MAGDNIPVWLFDRPLRHCLYKADDLPSHIGVLDLHKGLDEIERLGGVQKLPEVIVLGWLRRLPFNALPFIEEERNLDAKKIGDPL